MKRYGYHRTSTREQHLDRGIKVITAYCEQNNLGLEKIFTDQQTGKNFNRPRSPIIPNGGNYLMYIGKATKTESENLRARVRTYKKQFGEKYNRSKLHTMFTKWGEYVYVYYLPMKSSAADIKEIEDRLIAAYGRPPCNKEILIRSVKDAVDAAF